MKIVIDIPNRVYSIVQNKTLNIIDSEIVEKAIRNGIPIPKGHGDLIDRSKIYKAIPAEEDNCTGMGMSYEEMDAYNDGIDAMYSLVQGAPTIIEGSED